MLNNSCIKRLCPICGCEMIVGNCSWHFICRNCNYESSTLKPMINSDSTHDAINENLREEALCELRKSNFQKLLINIRSLKKNGDTLLEVGCAHGWFLEIAQKYYKVLGLEPDEAIYSTTLSHGLPIRKGFFPMDINQGEKFDIIVFNDVIEHIPDVESVLNDCFNCLNVDGLLVLNLPSSNGFFYTISKFLFRLGLVKSFERMWQKNMPSPHLHYFNQDNLIYLLEKKGFNVRCKGSLQSLKLKGLYTRVSYAGNKHSIMYVIIFVIIACSLPFLKFFPKDIFFITGIRK